MPIILTDVPVYRSKICQILSTFEENRERHTRKARRSALETGIEELPLAVEGSNTTSGTRDVDNEDEASGCPSKRPELVLDA